MTGLAEFKTGLGSSLSLCTTLLTLVIFGFYCLAVNSDQGINIVSSSERNYFSQEDVLSATDHGFQFSFFVQLQDPRKHVYDAYDIKIRLREQTKDGEEL